MTDVLLIALTTSVIILSAVYIAMSIGASLRHLVKQHKTLAELKAELKIRKEELAELKARHEPDVQMPFKTKDIR